jgi:hypothetical protein
MDEFILIFLFIIIVYTVVFSIIMNSKINEVEECYGDFNRRIKKLENKE